MFQYNVFFMHAYPNLGKVILASASPRRRELLASLGLEFSVLVPAIEETAKQGEPPRAFAERLAAEKAAAVPADPGTTIIAADTIVVQDGNILGKPCDEAHAAEMLSTLSGKTHEVITGVCIRTNAGSRVFSVSTEVEFRTLTQEEIADYVSSGCPMDKAGAYAIQGGAAHMVRAINGSYTNVVGLPLCELHKALISF
jgi:septum formation protein